MRPGNRSSNSLHRRRRLLAVRAFEIAELDHAHRRVRLAEHVVGFIDGDRQLKTRMRGSRRDCATSRLFCGPRSQVIRSGRGGRHDHAMQTLELPSRRPNLAPTAARNVSSWGIPGCTCDCAAPADTWAAVTIPRTATPPSISTPLRIRSSARSSRARAGAGATSTTPSCSWIERGVGRMASSACP